MPRGPGSLGEFGWAGAATTRGRIDPRERLLTLVFAQQFPLDEHGALRGKAPMRVVNAGRERFQGDLARESTGAVTRTSRVTACRELADLVLKGCLAPTAGGRSSGYRLAWPAPSA